jgi:plastocyanin
MKKTQGFTLSRTVVLLGGLLAGMAFLNAGATMHIIQFGGAFGFAYSPNNLTCNVGDTVKWEGSFNSHPLSSTSVPAGAVTFHQASGSSFSYAVLVAGTYHYKCDFHSGSGMVGQFTADAATGIEERSAGPAPESFALDQNYPNPFNPSTTLRYRIPETQRVALKIYDVLGNEVATLIDGLEPAGSREARFDGTDRPSGVYYARLEADHFTAVRRLTLMK